MENYEMYKAAMRVFCDDPAAGERHYYETRWLAFLACSPAASKKEKRSAIRRIDAMAHEWSKRATVFN